MSDYFDHDYEDSAPAAEDVERAVPEGGIPDLKLDGKTGDFQIRIVSPIYRAARHWVTLNGKRVVRCCPRTWDKDTHCPICDTGRDPQRNYACWIIDRTAQKAGERPYVKRLQGGSKSLFGTILMFKQSKRFGNNYHKFDIVIHRTEGKGGDTYSPPPEALDDTDLTPEEASAVTQMLKKAEDANFSLADGFKRPDEDDLEQLAASLAPHKEPEGELGVGDLLEPAFEDEDISTEDM